MISSTEERERKMRFTLKMNQRKCPHWSADRNLFVLISNESEKHFFQYCQRWESSPATRPLKSTAWSILLYFWRCKSRAYLSNNGRRSLDLWLQLLIHTESIATMDAAKGRDLNATHHLLNASDFRCCQFQGGRHLGEECQRVKKMPWHWHPAGVAEWAKVVCNG